MTNTEIVNKLIGPINPIGESSEDDIRFKNLRSMCELVDDLISQIKSVHYDNKDSRELSVKRSAIYAWTFINDGY